MEKVIYGPSIYTMDGDDRVVEALGIEKGKICSLGDKEQVLAESGANTEELNLSAGSIFPGFNDAHLHLLDLGLYELFYLDLSQVSSKSELLEKVQEKVDETDPGQWILGSGWDESDWTGEQEPPRREELDQVTSDYPIALQRVDMHTFSVNSPGIEEMDVTRTTKGARTEGGRFTGVFSENASLKVKQAIALDLESRVKALKKSISNAHSKGVTAVSQMVVDPGEFARYFEAFQQLSREGQLDIRSLLYFTENYLDQVVDLGLETGFGSDRLRIGGLKLFADGSIGSKTAWVREPYSGDPDNRGMSIWEKEDLLKLVKKADRNGIQLAIHTIGDRALDQVLECLQQTLAVQDCSSLRHRIEHCELARRDQIEQMSELGLIASMQPNYVGKWGLPGSMYEGRLGRAKLPELNQFKVFQEKGVDLAFGSDGMPFDPLFGIHWAVNAPFDSQKLSPTSALRAYTGGGAFVEGVEQKIGSIEPGKYADLVVLDGDPIQEPGSIKDLKVMMTIFNGEVVYKNETTNF
ncbi:MAG: amidohydrolase [Candidatus Bipolaricaulota bacterium]